ncbi:MAG: PP2C family protein-serine/threonine phosphatase [Phycisphaerales bacterium]
MTALAFTSDFAQAFERQTTKLLRERFVWFTGIVALVSIAWLVGSVSLYVALRSVAESAANAPTGSRTGTYVGFAQHGFDALLYGLICVQAWRRPIPDLKLVRITGSILLFDGFATLILDAVSGQWGTLSFWGMLLPHLLATVFLPWNLWQALKPILPVLAFNTLLCLGSDLLPGASGSGGWGAKVLVILMSLLVPLPGMMVAAIKHDTRVRSFKLQFTENLNRNMRRELADARRIHESLFPRAEARGSIRFDYRYQPMRLIGGDYLYARFDESESSDEPALTLLLMDVTGHGVAAALTVNRLYGEVERLFGENPRIRPGQVVAALNRYVYHTLANHALYVTAVCARIDPGTDRMEYASAGHPPMFLRAVDGTIEQLDSTTFLLGAVRNEEFDATPLERPFVRGDTLLMYTDGAMEAADASGRQLGITGLLRAIASCGQLGAGDWPAMLLTAVDRHRAGPPEDDTLVVEVARLIVPVAGLAPGEKRVTVVHDGKAEGASPRG